MYVVGFVLIFPVLMEYCFCSYRMDMEILTPQGPSSNMQMRVVFLESSRVIFSTGV